ncbi:MAG: DNA methyltransferase [Phycisphaerales bacterium]
MTFTLHHGDCLDVLATLPDASVDFIFTDPPYGHNNNNGDLIHRIEAAMPTRLSRTQRIAGLEHGEARAIANDGAEADEVFTSALVHFPRLLREGGCCCCCGGGGGPDPMFARWSLALDEALEFKQMVVWDKGPMGMGWHYRRSYETVLVAMKPGAACRWYDETGRVENIIRPGYKGIRKIIPSAEQHPTPKPIELVKHFLGLHTKRGAVVLDPFMGGGTTGEACVEMGRDFIGIELDEQWYNYARHRIESADAQQRMDLTP